jgi:hypothetical protein
VIDNDSLDNLPDGAREVSPLVIMLGGISIPVALIAVAAAGGSVAVLVLAIVAMFAVGGLTMGFMALITGDSFSRDDTPEEPGASEHLPEEPGE